MDTCILEWTLLREETPRSDCENQKSVTSWTRVPRISRTHRRSRIREYFVHISYHPPTLHFIFSLRCSLFPAGFSLLSISSNDARENVPSCARIAFRDNVDMLTHCSLIRDAFEIVFPRATSSFAFRRERNVSCAFFSYR